MAIRNGTYVVLFVFSRRWNVAMGIVFPIGLEFRALVVCVGGGGLDVVGD